MESNGTDVGRNSWTHGLKNPRTIARVLGLVLFGLLFWIEHPPTFLRHESYGTYIFAVLIWLGEILAYAIGIAGVIVLLLFLASHVYDLLRRARRWYRLQEIRAWRAKRACNFQR
jgi:hypothetical protein